MPKQKLESDIQAEISRALQKAGWLVNKVIQCTNNGWVDLEAFHTFPRCAFIEVKRPGEKPRPLQEYRHEQLRSRGWTVIVADSLADVSELLK